VNNTRENIVRLISKKKKNNLIDLLFFKKIIILFVLVIFSRFVGHAQDPRFSQFYANPLYLAPSFAGATEENRLALNYRNQWPSLPGVFLTYSFSYDHYFANFNSGIGILATHDRAGSGRLSNTNIGVMYSYNIKINKYLFIRPGLSFYYTQRGLDFWRLVFSDGMSPGGDTPTIEQPPFDNINDIDAGASILAYTDRIWLGTTVDHMLRPNQSLYGEISKIPMKISVFGGVQVIKKGRLLKPLEESLSIAFHFETQGKFTQLDLGLYWLKSPMVFGFWYRGLPGIHDAFDRDALVFLVGYKTKQIQIGYSYDFTISKLVGATGGSHEISFIYEFKTNKHRKRKIHAIPCPEF
jgi:type IX secretion system PorP/SprF family membrane protein